MLMPIEVKICGLSTRSALEAAVNGGALYVGFVFFRESPRYVEPAYAGSLAATVPSGVFRVGLVVDAEDALLREILARVPLDMLQLHGSESPRRVAEIRERFGLPIMKAIAIAERGDFADVADYAAVSDRLLFDAQPPADASRPGGNALSFDWRLLGGRRWPVPWLLAGGLDTDNLAEAVRLSGADEVDVSSGVEDAPGHKSVDKIRSFLAAAARLQSKAGHSSEGALFRAIAERSSGIAGRTICRRRDGWACKM
jgi:phosphoribosylanthranilate isomerase